MSSSSVRNLPTCSECSRLGLELPAATDSGALIAAALRKGIILLADGPAGGVLAFAPPFAISDEEIACACAWLQEYLMSLLGSSS